MTPEDSTLDNEELNQEARWSYYVSAYAMRDPTEGIPFSRMRIPFLKRNLPPKLEQEEEYDRFYRPLAYHDGLVIRICANSYHILYEPNTSDWWWREEVPAAEESARENADTVKQRRRDRFEDKFVKNPSWMAQLDKEKVDGAIRGFHKLVGAEDKTRPVENKEEQKRDNEDTEMTDVDPGPRADAGASAGAEATEA